MQNSTNCTKRKMPLLRETSGIVEYGFLITLTKNKAADAGETKLWNVSGDTAGSCEGPVFGGRPEKAG